MVMVGGGATMPADFSMKAQQPHKNEEKNEERGRVLRFEPRRGSTHPPRPSVPPTSPVEDLGKYGGAREERDDYRHRMKTNLAALIVLGLLIWCGYWLFDTIAEMRKNQDCALSGRTNCVRLNVSPNNR